MASSSATSSAESVKKFIQDALNSLNSEHPEWNNPKNNNATICIPENFETVRKYIASKIGVKDKNSKVANRGDAAEQTVFDALKNLNIGAILVSNVDMVDFFHKAKAVTEQYEKAVRKYNKYEKASALTGGEKCPPLSRKFESEFILFHPRFGVYCIEVKSVVSPHSLKKAKTQVYEVPLKLKLLFQAINETDSCEIPIRAAAFFPNGQLTEQSKVTIRLKNHDAEILAKDGFATPESFRQFWTTVMNESVGDNLFKNERFRRFIAVLCCYRGAVCLNGTLNAVRIAELVHQQLSTPKMNSFKAAQLSSRREMQLSALESIQNVIFLTEKQQEVEMCTDKLQLIFGSPGTGKTLLLLLQALKASQTESTGRLFVYCKSSYKTKFKNYFKANKNKFAPGREPIISDGKNAFDFDEDDDIFCDELAIEHFQFLKMRIKNRGRTVCVVTNDIYPNNCGIYVETFASLKHYTMHILKTVMRGSANIVNYWKENLIDANFTVGHGIVGPVVKPPQKCPTIRETLQAVFDRVTKLIRQGAKPNYIAVITSFSEEAMMVRAFIEKESDKQLHVSGAEEEIEDADLVVVEETKNVLSHEWPFVIACSLFCVDIDNSFMLMASSRAIAQLTIVQRDYHSMQNCIETYMSSHPVNPSSGFTGVKQRVEEAIKFYLNGSSESHGFIFSLHLCLTIMRSNIFPLSDDDSNEIFQSCRSFTDFLVLVMRDPTLMRLIAADYIATIKSSEFSKHDSWITAMKPNKSIAKIFANVHHLADSTATSELIIKTCYKFVFELADNLCIFVHENHGNIVTKICSPKIFPFTKNGHECWHFLLAVMQLIFGRQIEVTQLRSSEQYWVNETINLTLAYIIKKPLPNVQDKEDIQSVDRGL